MSGRLLLLLLCALCASLQSTLAWVEDMENQNLFEGDIILSPEEKEAMEKGENIYGSIKGYRWLKVNGYVHVPFDYHENIRTVKAAIQGIEAAMADYHKYTCIRFRRRANEKVYLLFFDGGGCASRIGKVMRNSPQKVVLGPGCWTKGTVIHELGHAMGMWHEQNRPDRDKFVKINFKNIQERLHEQFKKATTRTVDSLGTPYDYRSIMHYGETAFGKGKITMETTDPYYQHIIGKSSGFSKVDIKQLNLMYQCPAYTGPYPARQQTDKCYDAHEFCPRYVAQKGCRDRKNRQECPFTCNLCGTERGTNPLPTFPAVTIPQKWKLPTTKDPNPNCPYKDVWSYCKDLKSYCNDRSWVDRMKINCRKTCNFCGNTGPTKPTPVTASPSCRDTTSRCARWKKHCNRSSWVRYLKANCKRTCNFC